MARKTRLYLANLPCHIHITGNNMQNCFYCPADYDQFSALLDKASKRYQIAIHAFVILDNQVHLLITPSRNNGIARLMQYISSCYVRYFNQKYQRCGSLFQGRHKAAIVDEQYYLLCCMRFIEYLPVQLGLVNHPCEYARSSYQSNAHHLHVETSNINLVAHPTYLNLGSNLLSRKSNYQRLFLQENTELLSHYITERLQHNHPIGSSDFIEHLKAVYKLVIPQMKAGRPKSIAKAFDPKALRKQRAVRKSTGQFIQRSGIVWR